MAQIKSTNVNIAEERWKRIGLIMMAMYVIPAIRNISNNSITNQLRGCEFISCPFLLHIIRKGDTHESIR